jgi:hypothetical protein
MFQNSKLSNHDMNINICHLTTHTQLQVKSIECKLFANSFPTNLCSLYGHYQVSFVQKIQVSNERTNVREGGGDCPPPLHRNFRHCIQRSRTCNCMGEKFTDVNETDE